MKYLLIGLIILAVLFLVIDVCCAGVSKKEPPKQEPTKTLKEVVLEKYPECTDTYCKGGVRGCPHGYDCLDGHYDEEYLLCKCGTGRRSSYVPNEEVCIQCWNRIYQN